MRELADWLTSYMEYTDNSEPCELYRKWVGIGTIAAALQRKCWFPNGPITWYPNLYIVIIGGSGVRKTTALSQANIFLRDQEAQIKLSPNSLTRERLIIDLRQAKNNFLDNHGTYHPHTSLTIYNGELTVFLGYNNLQMLTDLTNWYDCEDTWVYGTKHGENKTDTLENLCVNIIGATTPEALQASLPTNAIAIGLTARMLFIYSDKKGKKVPMPHFRPWEFELQAKLLNDYRRISQLSGPFEPTLEFLQAYAVWYDSYENDPIIQDERFNKYYERKAATVCKLACILCASRSDKMILEEQDLENSVGLIDEAEYFMQYALSGFGRSDLAAMLDRIMMFLMKEQRTNIRELMRRYRRELTRLELEQLIETMVPMRFCTYAINTGELLYNQEFEETERENRNRGIRSDRD